MIGFLQRVRLSGIDKLLLILGMIIGIKLRLVGEFYISGILLAVMFFYEFPNRNRLDINKMPYKMPLLLGLWFFSQIVTDIIRMTPPEDLMRGWAKLFIFTMSMCAFYVFTYCNRRRLLIANFSLSLGVIIEALVMPTQTMVEQLWKFGIGAPLTICVAALCSSAYIRKQFGWVIIGSLVGLSLVHMLYGFRSMSLITFGTAVYLFFQMYIFKYGREPIKPITIMFSVVTLILAPLLFKGIYSYSLEHALTKWDFKQKVMAQSTSPVLLSFLGGRSEIWVSSRAIWDSPIIGHGSWARDREEKYRPLLLDLDQLGLETNPGNLWEEDLIPTHSHLTGAWVEAGFAGAVFWMVSLFIIFRVLFRLFRYDEPLSPLLVLLGIMMVWDILFSPFGGQRSITDAALLILFLSADAFISGNAPEKQSDYFLMEAAYA